MSEHVGAKRYRQKFDKKAGKLAYDQIESDDDTSKEAHKSDLTKLSSVAVVSPPIALVETSRSVEAFKLGYDRLFREFQERLLAEYGAQRTSYMSEYQDNFL